MEDMGTAAVFALLMAFVSGTLVFEALPASSPAVLWAIALPVLLATLWGMRRRRNAAWGLCLVALLLGGIRGSIATFPGADDYRRVARLRDVAGTVVSYPTRGGARVTFDLALDALPWCLRVTCDGLAPEALGILYGDRLRVRATGRAPSQDVGFDYRAYLARRGILGTMWVDDPTQIEHLGEAEGGLLRLGDAARQWVFRRLDRLLSPEAADFARALLFAERSGLSEEIEEAFSRTGLMHLLAISGLHLGVLLAGLWGALRAIGTRPCVAYPIVACGVLAILWIVGPRVSLVRAAMMFGFLGAGSVLVDFGLILRRWVSPFRALAAAAIVIVALRPTAWMDVGFQLSFAATAGILVAFSPGIGLAARLRRIGAERGVVGKAVRWICALLLASGAAQASTAPFIAYHFESIHPFALLANGLAIPLVSLTLWGGVVTIALLATPAAGGGAVLFEALLQAVAGLVRWLGRIPGSSFTVSPETGIWIGGLVLFLGAVATYGSGGSSWIWKSTSIGSREPLERPGRAPRGGRGAEA